MSKWIVETEPEAGQWVARVKEPIGGDRDGPMFQTVSIAIGRDEESAIAAVVTEAFLEDHSGEW